MSDPLVGHVLGDRYEILSRIARGGMATVYVGTDLRLSRTVAVKVMHEGLGDDADFVRKFEREARLAAGLSHPNVVAVFDQGREAGRPYIVMEYVEGTTLRTVINRDSPLEPLRALELMEPVLAALAAAHAHGLVHRDVKPENVLISSAGQVKVADFGLAKAITGDSATATQGLLIGTVSYIPPELVQQGRADERSDVYSAGIVLFEMLTGRKPHTGDTPITVAYAHCNVDVPPPSTMLERSWRTSRGAIPPYVDTLVQAATSRDPDSRPLSAGVLLEHLRLARDAVEKGVMNDPRLDAEMRRIDDPALDRPPADEPTTALPLAATARPAAAAASAWRPGRIHTTPSTPVSPVDLQQPSDGVPFYDDLAPVQPQRTPHEPVRQRSPRRQPTPVAYAHAPARERMKRRRRRGVLVLLLVLLLTSGVGVGSWWLLAGQYTAAPGIAGQTRAVAEETARSAGLGVSFVDEFSETVGAGVVIRSDPGAGQRVPRNGSLTAYLSKGPERFAVPTVAGLPRERAEAALRTASLAVGAVTEDWSETVAVGSVIAATPAAGALLKKGASVDLVISKGPQPIAIADFTGKSAADARASLEKAGFKVALSEDNSKTVAKGNVISQTPAGGQGHRGDTVALVVSKGPVMVMVPTTRGMSQEQATQTLQKAGFQVAAKALPNPVPLGIVSYSDPPGGSQAPEGSTINIYVT